MSPQTPPLFIKALSFAAQRHREQRRKGAAGNPYINHPIELVEVLSATGGIHDSIVHCVALLHDVLEDTNTSYQELCEEFSQEIADLVMELTDDKALSKAERKRLQVLNAPRKSKRAKQVSLADKICNLQELPRSWKHEDRLEYFQWAYQVVKGLRGTNTALEERFDQIYEDGMKRLNP